MAELKVIRREWQIEVRFSPGEVPDAPKRYSSIIMRPYAASIEFASGQTGLIRLSKVTIHGHRVLKNDRLGMSAGETLYSAADMPDWLDSLVTEALALILGDSHG